MIRYTYKNNYGGGYMKRLENTPKNRLKQCSIEIENLNKELNNPDNFVKNKYYNVLEVKEDTKHGD